MISKFFENANPTSRIIKIKAKDRSVWENVPEAMRKEIIAKSDAICKEPWEDLPLSLYQEFSKNGNRSNFQAKYFKKRKNLTTLVTAECIEYKGRFIRQIANGMWSLISEPAWVIPAHNSYIRDTKQLESPLIERPILDLFACETGEILSLSLSLLEDELRRTVGDIFIQDAKYEIQRRILKPYLTEHFWWMGDNNLNNWSVWCTQNVLLSLSCLDLSEDESKKVVKTATETIDQWLEQYGDDGCCDEGALYWHAAGLCLWGSIELLDRMCNGKASEIFNEEKIKNIGHYIINVLVDDDIYLNFADCSPKAGRLGAREYLFGKAINDQDLIDKAVSDYKKNYDEKYIKKTATPEPEDENYNLWYRVLEIIYAKEILGLKTKALANKNSFTAFSSVGLYIYRRKDITFAIKAGNNDDSHNHNDVGSVILYKKTHPLLIDVGVETYSKTTFSPERYTLWPMQSFYHNISNFGPFMQEAGEKYKATDVEVAENSISMELKDAYNKEAHVESYKRTAKIFDDKIEIIDSVKCAIKPTLSIMTMNRPQKSDKGLSFGSWRIDLISEDAISRDDIDIEEISISDERLRRAWPDKLYRTRVRYSNKLIWDIIA